MSNPYTNQYQGVAQLRERLMARKGTHIADHLVRMEAPARAIHGQLKAMGDIVAHPDPTQNEAHRFKHVSTRNGELKRNSTALVNTASEAVVAAMSHLHTLANNRLKLNADSKYHGVVLQKFVGLSSKADQVTMLNTALKDGDHETMGIILNAPTSVTGLSKDERERYRMEHIKVHAPDIADDFEIIEQAHQTILSIDRSVQIAAASISDPRTLAEIDKGIELAKAADAAFVGTGGAV